MILSLWIVAEVVEWLLLYDTKVDVEDKQHWDLGSSQSARWFWFYLVRAGCELSLLGMVGMKA